MDVFLESCAEQSAGRAGMRVATSSPLKSKTMHALAAEVRHLQDRSVRYVSVRRQQVRLLGSQRLLEVLNDAGIRVSSLGYAGGFTGSLQLSFEDAVEDAARAVDLAIELSARSLIILPGSQALHIRKHAEQSIRMGLQMTLSHVSQRSLRLLVPSESLFCSGLGLAEDFYRPSGEFLEWLHCSTGTQVQPLIVVRGHQRISSLPNGWKQSVQDGGVLRLCPQCGQYERNARRARRLARILSQRQLSHESGDRELQVTGN
jgi:hypothetical protein